MPSRFRIILQPHNKKAEQNPLLRSPFSGAGQHAISSLSPDWADVEHSFARHQQIKEMVIGNRIGGAFWLGAPKLPSTPKEVVVLASCFAPAKRLWLTMLDRFSAESLAVLVHPSRQTAPLVTAIAASGAHIIPVANPHFILEIANAVYAAEDCDLGTLAALAGIPSFKFHDGAFEKLSPKQRSAWIDAGTRYTDPYTGNRAGIEQIAEILHDWRRIFQRNRAIIACTGISLWKRPRMAQLLHNGESPPRFHRSAESALKAAAAQGGAVAAWTTRIAAKLPPRAAEKNIPLIRLEDGFIRSAGLGSGLLPPASIVADRQGIYFDPRQPSDLETLLNQQCFSDSILRRARRLTYLLTSKDVSKYGSGGKTPNLHAKPTQRIILVPGQVADDLSLQRASFGHIRCNLALLREVRRRNPDAFIAYRPHPDVVAGHRAGAIADPVALGLADQHVPNGAIAALIARVDEVHTMTSLTGFEALLRGKIVQTYGQPFYAGWGLTIDHAPIERRRRRLQLDELVAGALILYPHYIDPATGLPCGPEILIARMQQPELWRPSLLMRLRQLQGGCRRTLTHWADMWIRSNA